MEKTSSCLSRDNGVMTEELSLSHHHYFSDKVLTSSNSVVIMHTIIKLNRTGDLSSQGEMTLQSS